MEELLSSSQRYGPINDFCDLQLTIMKWIVSM